MLHGAGGRPDQQLIGAVRCGVTKTTISTELRQAYLTAVASVLTTVLGSNEVSPCGVLAGRP